MVDHGKVYEQHLKEKFDSIRRENPGMSPVDAMKKAESEIRTNNPFFPPKGCPVNELPNELLAQIFHAGVELDQEEDDEEEDVYDDTLDILEEWETSDEEDEGPSASRSVDKGKQTKKGKESTPEEDEDESDDEEEDERPVPFQILVSHVCRHWREVAIETPTLWTSMNFTYGSSLEAAKVWVERSKTQPLEISIDCSLPDHYVSGDDLSEEEDAEMNNGDSSTAFNVDSETPRLSSDDPKLPIPRKEEVSRFLDIIIPHVGRWRAFTLVCSHYDRVYPVLERLAQCGSAPQLELLELYSHDDVEQNETFEPPALKHPFVLFGSNAPKLKRLVLWGVHLDWEASLPFFQHLVDLELTYQADDVRPSFETFGKMLSSSPDLQSISLAQTGPRGPQQDWGSTIVDLSHLKELAIGDYEVEYILALLPCLHIPNVNCLSIDLDGGDFTELAMMLSRPIGERKTSILSGIQFFKITSMPCNTKARETMLEQLVNLKTFNLNCSDEEEEEFFKLLMKLNNSDPASPTVLYCPNLSAIYTTGIDGKDMKAFVEARRRGGVPLTKVGVSEEDEVEERDEKWLKGNVEEFERFEPDSDYEEEYVEVGDDEMFEDGEDMMDEDQS
ncbi:hypothetical protein VNI00_002476 [Paramarasmius palmivorus]|uniref:F-box domain-containing protein n=1 Tax=Paramarasmius palmivorus TaxID=297713 RepID=A0AAW0DUN6_9AGAR